MTTTVDAPPSGPPEDRPTPSAGRRRDTAQHGMLMARAIKLRDQVPLGRRRADTSRARSWAQIGVGLLLVSVGVTVLVTTGPAWNWAGGMAVGLGPAIAMLGVIDLARRGANGELCVERIFRTIRIGGAAVTMVLIGLEVLTALAAVALLVTAVIWGSWSEEVVYFLSNALVFATMAIGTMMMVRVADLRPVPLTRASWWRELGIFRQFTNIALPVAIVGATVALSLRDTRAVALAMIGLAAVLIGWARVDCTATDDAVRRLAEAADALTAAARRMAAALDAENPVGQAASCKQAVLDAPRNLDLASRKNIRRGIPGGPRYLVDVELLAVVNACMVVLADPPVTYAGSPLAAMVARDLDLLEPRQLVREIQIFAGDIRRLATLAPDRARLA